jgi:protein involved in ribonucleotide reduction
MSATYTLATDVAAKQFSVTGVLKFQHKGAWVDKKSFFGMWQCFKNAASLDAKDMRCFAW